MKKPFVCVRPLVSVTVAAALCFISSSAAQEPAHPILPITGSGSGADALLSNYTEAQFLEFVPMQAPRDDSFLAPIVPGDTGWSWSNTAPNQLRSTPSNTVFPTTNPAYLERTESVVVLGKNGLTTVQVPYYLAAGSTTRKVLVQAYIDYRKRGQLRSWLGTLAAAYVRSGSSPATRDDRYARRAALALDAWAHAVPNYFMTEKNSASFINATTNYVLARDIQRASDHNGMAHEWNSAEILAFDAIYDSTAFATLSAEKGYDVRAHIRDNLFFNIGDYFKNRVPISLAINTNLSGPFSNFALVARAFNRPDYITWMGDYLDNTINKKLTRDGVLVEGISYSDGYLNENLEGAENTRDYFLTRPADTPELTAIQAATTGYAAIIQAGLNRWHAVRLPNGQFPPFGDTNFNTSTARNAGNSAILAAYGHAAIGAGSGAQAVQLNTNLSTESNHMRADVGAFTLWALGTELLGNVRYFNGTPGRQFGEQILSHNAVTIDRSNMSRGTGWNVGGRDHVFTPGHLMLYEPGNNGLAVIEIDAQRPYANKASRYQRILILNTADLARPYLIDVFRVAGGTTHDYTLHGSIRYDQVGESSFTLTPNPATYPLLEGSETWSEPTSSGSSFPYYGFFRNVSSGTAPENFQITFRESPGTGKKDARLWVTKQEGATVHLARTPIAARSNSEPADFYGFWRPSVIVRKRIASGTQQSLFANVIEPLRDGVSTIQSVQQLPLTGGATQEAVALRITFTDGRVDTCLVNLRNPRVIGGSAGNATIATADGRYSLTGRIGAHLQATSGSRIWTMAASSFTYAGNSYTPGTQTYTGNINGVTRQAAGAANDAFIVSGTLPAGTALRGRHVSMTFGNYQVVNQSTVQTGLNEMFEIDRVETIGGQTHVILKSDPRLTISGTTTTELMAPQRTFTGTNTYEITLSETAAALAPVLLAQTITFPDLPTGKRVGDADFSPGATSGSGLAVTYTSSNPSVATIVNGQIRLVAAGTTTITASQAGDATYAAATSVSKTLTVDVAAIYSTKVQYNTAGRLNYPADANRNRIPDFSHAGYKGGGVPLPTFTTATPSVSVSPITGDDTATIQAAIDQVGNLPLQSDGYRGIVQLTAGTFDVAGTLRMNRSGVVLAGVGDGTDPVSNTILRRPLPATGTNDHTPIINAGGGTLNNFRSEIAGSRRAITTDFVPVGSRQFTVENITGLAVGDTVIILHPSTAAWLTAMNNGGVTDANTWKVGEIDVRYHRYIRAIDGNTITIDAPVFMHLDRSLSQSHLYKYNRNGVLTNLGIQNLRIDIDTAGPTAETHSEDAITIVQAEDAWVRDCTILHFWHAGIQFSEATRSTVERVRALEPHSLVDGGRRYNFATYHGQLILFRDCVASDARHGLVANGTSNDSGNVFLDCVLDRNITFSEGHRRWSTGLLFDRITATNRVGNDVLGFYNRGNYGTGHGWAVGHGVIWNSDAAGGRILVQQPPTAQNYAIGNFGNVTGTGPFAGAAGFREHSNIAGIQPDSLYLEQLRLRLLGGTTLAPQVSPAGGTYTSAQTVTLTSGDLDATIRYTTDGSAPTATTGTVYTAPLNVSATATIRALAVQVGLAPSAVTSATYTINATTPPTTPPAAPPPASGGGGGGGGGSTDPRFLLALALLYFFRRYTRVQTAASPRRS